MPLNKSLASSITAADESKPVSTTSESPKKKIQPPSKPYMNANTTSPRVEFGPSTVEDNLELKPSVSSLQPSQLSQPANSGVFVDGFGTSTTAQAPIPSGLGQPAQVGPGQQTLRSVLGDFGQLRRLAHSLPGTGFGSSGGFGGGIAVITSTGGFTSAGTGGFAGFASGIGGFASLASGGGGSAVAASGGSGFVAVASGGGGFSDGGFGAGMNETASPKQNVTVNAQQEQLYAGHSPFPKLPTMLGSVTGGIDGLDVQNAEEYDMDEETPVTSRVSELSLGNLGGFGLGCAPKPNQFGGSFGNAQTNATSLFSRHVPSGELFQPASFSFQSLQPSQLSQPANSGVFVDGFGTSTTAQAPFPSGFGQPAQVGPGQQVLRSVLGDFGQLRRLGTSLPSTGFGSPDSFGGGIASITSTDGFISVAAGGFAGFASGGGGFASLASGGGGSAVAASDGRGFAIAASDGGGFSGAVSGDVGFGGTASGGGGFRAFGGQQGSGGFFAFGGVKGTRKPSELFTQMRK